jgi:hypothetical protein
MKEIQLSNRRVFFVKKGKKYLEGHGYATGLGYSYFWTSDIKKARKMDLNLAVNLSQSTNGKIIYLEK